MRIYGENDHIVFECDYCGCKAEIPAAKSKRGFMRQLNAFAWQHDNSCKWTKNRKDRTELSEKIAEQAIAKMVSSCR